MVNKKLKLKIEDHIKSVEKLRKKRKELKGEVSTFSDNLLIDAVWGCQLLEDLLKTIKDKEYIYYPDRGYVFERKSFNISSIGNRKSGLFPREYFFKMGDRNYSIEIKNTSLNELKKTWLEFTREFLGD